VRVRWTQRAAQDLQDIGDFIARDQPAAARRWVARLRDRARKATSAPKAGRKVPELDREDVREVFLGSYRIIYRIYPDFMDILMVFEGHRLLPMETLPQDLQEND
jgi:toxin ParE1/3/4